jgi:hypothetical protein
VPAVLDANEVLDSGLGVDAFPTAVLALGAIRWRDQKVEIGGVIFHLRGRFVLLPAVLDTYKIFQASLGVDTLLTAVLALGAVRRGDQKVEIGVFTRH